MEAEKLLEKIKLIKFKYENELNDKNYDFNIFSILRSRSDEVNLHSKFISELLNPSGSHGHGKAFLDIFLKKINVNDFIHSNVFVKIEYKNIDIYISNDKSQSIILENKIYAEDQNKQLERYYNKINSESIEDIRVIYLTLDGRSASEKSIGNLTEKEVDIENISYKDTIYEWLELCIKEVATCPVLRETLVQYKRLIQELTGKSPSKGYIMDIKNVLLNEENLSIATGVAEALTEAKIEVQLSFWSELSKKISEKGYVIIQDTLYTREKVSDFYKKSRRKNKHYGIVFKVFSYTEKASILYKIHIDHYIYHGFCFVENDSWKIEEGGKFDCLAKKVHDIDSDFKRTDWWLGWKYSKPKINFRAFNSSAVFALSDSNKRNKYIVNLVKDIEKGVKELGVTIEDCKKDG